MEAAAGPSRVPPRANLVLGRGLHGPPEGCPGHPLAVGAVTKRYLAGPASALRAWSRAPLQISTTFGPKRSQLVAPVPFTARKSSRVSGSAVASAWSVLSVKR